MFLDAIASVLKSSPSWQSLRKARNETTYLLAIPSQALGEFDLGAETGSLLEVRILSLEAKELNIR